MNIENLTLTELAILQAKVAERIVMLLAEQAANNTDIEIGNVEAKRIAAEANIRLSTSTLVSACESGVIQSARKVGGRWYYPRKAFDTWLSNYSPKPR